METQLMIELKVRLLEIIKDYFPSDYTELLESHKQLCESLGIP